jgi:hypothetical protein
VKVLEFGIQGSPDLHCKDLILKLVHRYTTIPFPRTCCVCNGHTPSIERMIPTANVGTGLTYSTIVVAPRSLDISKLCSAATQNEEWSIFIPGPKEPSPWQRPCGELLSPTEQGPFVDSAVLNDFISKHFYSMHAMDISQQFRGPQSLFFRI